VAAGLTWLLCAVVRARNANRRTVLTAIERTLQDASAVERCT
jgi:hypothetical protein